MSTAAAATVGELMNSLSTTNANVTDGGGDVVAHQQASIVSSWWNSSSVAHETRGIINADWFNRWCAHVGFDPVTGSAMTPNPNVKYPGSIDNRSLRSTSRANITSKYHLVPNLKDGIDYYDVPEKVANAMFQWYGGMPQIKRETCIRLDLWGKERVVVELYPFIFTVYEADMHTGEIHKGQMEIHCIDPRDNFQIFVESFQFKYQPQSTLSIEDRRLWGRRIPETDDYDDSSPDQWRLILDDDLVIDLADLGLGDGIELRIEQAFEGSGWPCGSTEDEGDDAGAEDDYDDYDHGHDYDYDGNLRSRHYGGGGGDDANKNDDDFQEMEDGGFSGGGNGYQIGTNFRQSPYFGGSYSTGNYSTGSYSTGSYSTGSYSTGSGSYCWGDDVKKSKLATDLLVPYNAAAAAATDTTTAAVNAQVITIGTAGLCNLGNTCFMNSILQCLSHTPSLVDFFLTEKFKADLNPTNPLGWKGKVATAFNILVKDLWSGWYKHIRPVMIKQVIGKFQPRFAGYQQHDSAELLDFMLDGLHEDLNRVIEKPTTSAVEGRNRPDKDIADEAWSVHLMRNQSIIVDEFQGQLRSELHCPECKNTSVTFDAYSLTAAPLPGTNDRIITVTLVPSNHQQQPPQSLQVYSFRLNKFGTIQDLQNAVCEISGKSNDMIVADVWNHFIFRFLGGGELLSSIRPCDQIYIYEITVPEELNVTQEQRVSWTWKPVQVLHQWREDPTKLHSLSFGISIPIVTVVPTGPVAESEAEAEAAADAKVSSTTIAASDAKEEQEAAEVDDVMMADVHHQQQACDLSVTLQQVSQGMIRHVIGMVRESAKAIASTHTFRVAYLSDIAGRYCAKCSVPGCTGCPLPIDAPDGVVVDHGSVGAIAIQWQAIDCDSEKEKEDNANAATAAENLDLDLEQLLDQHLSRILPIVEDSSVRQLALELSSPKAITLMDCLDAYTTPEILGEHDAWYCSSCKKHQQATKVVQFWKLPNVFIIQLKRFSFACAGRVRSKLSMMVDFPVEGLDMSGRCLDPSIVKDECIYDLMAVSNHFGSAGGGHYTAYAKNEHDGKWYDYNDSFVSEIPDISTLVTDAAYVLFYKRRLLHQPPQPEDEEASPPTPSSSSSI